jgi:glyoxylase-like metal-dependent hydrolase (beta-lactamase superfamily II)
MPFLDLEAANPIEDYLTALRLFDGVVDDVEAVIPGHGSVGEAEHSIGRAGLVARHASLASTAARRTRAALDARMDHPPTGRSQLSLPQSLR